MIVLASGGAPVSGVIGAAGREVDVQGPGERRVRQQRQVYLGEKLGDVIFALGRLRCIAGSGAGDDQRVRLREARFRARLETERQTDGAGWQFERRSSDLPR